MIAERDNYHKLYENNVREVNKSVDKINKQDERVSQLMLKLGNSEQEIEFLKEEIARYQLEEFEKS